MPAARPSPSRRPAFERALAFLDAVPLVDGHNDMPWVIREDRSAKGDVARYGADRVHQETDTDLVRLKDGKVAAQWLAAYIPSDIAHPGRTVLEQIDIVHQIWDQHSELVLAAQAPGDVAKARRLGKIAIFLAIEGGVGLENALAPLRVWHAAGARLMTLCHNDSLDWIDSATDTARNGGLTKFGRAIVEELNRLGMIVDCAHVAPHAMHHVLDATRAPIVWSHGNAMALCAHRRNVPDDVLDRVPKNGGLVMATFIPSFLKPARLEWEQQFQKNGLLDFHAMTLAHQAAARSPAPRATVADVADHIEYIANRIGVDHVGIGSDYFGSGQDVPEGLENVSCFPNLFAELIGRGWSDKDLSKLASGNFLRVFRKVDAIGRTLRKTESPRTGQIGDYDRPESH
ncbi:MAG: dipeptidase [Hyphomicrobiaceae bacterium]